MLPAECLFQPTLGAREEIRIYGGHGGHTTEGPRRGCSSSCPKAPFLSRLSLIKGAHSQDSYDYNRSNDYVLTIKIAPHRARTIRYFPHLFQVIIKQKLLLDELDEIIVLQPLNCCSWIHMRQSRRKLVQCMPKNASHSQCHAISKPPAVPPTDMTA